MTDPVDVDALRTQLGQLRILVERAEPGMTPEARAVVWECIHAHNGAFYAVAERLVHAESLLKSTCTCEMGHWSALCVVHLPDGRYVLDTIPEAVLREVPANPQAPLPAAGPARRECGCLVGYPCGLGCALLVAAAPPTEPTDGD